MNLTLLHTSRAKRGHFKAKVGPYIEFWKIGKKAFYLWMLKLKMNIILRFTAQKKVQMIEKQVSLKKRTFTVLHEKREDRGHKP